MVYVSFNSEEPPEKRRERERREQRRALWRDVRRHAADEMYWRLLDPLLRLVAWARSFRTPKRITVRLTRAVERAPGSRRRAAAAHRLSRYLLWGRRRPADSTFATRLLTGSGDRDLGTGPAEAARLADLVIWVEMGWAGPSTAAPSPDADAARRRLAALPSTPVRRRIEALQACARARVTAEGPAAGYDDLAAAVALLPRSAGWGPSRGRPWQAALVLCPLRDTTLTSDAAACAIAAGRPTEAIELLETGRGVAWDRLLHARVRAELRAVDRRLVRRLDRACRTMEPSGHRLPVFARFLGTSAEFAEWPYTPTAALALRWRVVDEVVRRRMERRELAWQVVGARAQNALPDATFQQVEYLSDIRPAAAEGPVVALVLSAYGCHAVLVTADDDEPGTVELPALTIVAARHHARQYLTALHQLTGAAREASIQAVRYWLWDTIVQPVLAELALPAAGQEGHDVAARLWWCPSGPLAVLPLHAATPRPPDGTGRAPSMPRAVFSYTPTVRSLISARRARDLRRSTEAENGQRLLLVSIADRTGQAALPAVTRFRDFLTGLLPASRLTVLGGPDATVAQVRHALGRHDHVHFDCHGRQSVGRPEHTGLILHDQDLTIADFAEVGLSRPEFAFLAACDTASPDRRLLDEMVSLTSVLHYRGYQSVIGTMSPVLDRSTERIATAIYRRLAEEPAPPAPIAVLLHQAVGEERRRRPDHPSTWVPFIHVGI